MAGGTDSLSRLFRQPKAGARDRLIEKGLLVCASASIMIIITIFFFLIKEGAPTLWEVPPRNFWGTVWQAQSLEPKYGVLPLLTGSFLVTVGALLISLPLSIAFAVYLAEVANPATKEVLKPMTELLTGVPSVVYGFIALTAVADITHRALRTEFRLNALNAAIILAIMITPTIASISEDAIRAIPQEYRRAGLALGATDWEVTSKVIVPAAAPGILVAVMLGVGRAFGETMAVLMASGNAPILTFNILSAVQAMTATIAIEMGEVPFGTVHYHALFAIGILLFTITFVINLIAELAMQRVRRFYR
ncbi:MAG: phosphate ABC transporter permease subunit PstC [Candidatus Bathyarchaeia archaeon]